jgi:hypothetical protein
MSAQFSDSRDAMAFATSSADTLGFFYRPPAELHNAPPYILGVGAACPPRPRRARRGQSTSHAAPPLRKRSHAAPVSEKRKREQHAARRVDVADTCADFPMRAGFCRVRLDNGTVVAVPPRPHAYDRNLTDDDVELLVVELLPAEGSPEKAWLEDENVASVIVQARPHIVLVPREPLRMFVKQTVPVARCTRNLARSLHKMCRPLGSGGPVVTLLRASDVLGLAGSSSHAASSAHDLFQ